MLDDHYTNRIDIKRPTMTGNKKTFAQVVADVPCHIQPLSPTYQNGQWGRIQKEYRIFCGTQLLIGDKVVDQDGNNYEVFGAVSHDFRIGQRHYEALLRGV